jgi:hypothetical protein
MCRNYCFEPEEVYIVKYNDVLHVHLAIILSPTRSICPCHFLTPHLRLPHSSISPRCWRCWFSPLRTSAWSMRIQRQWNHGGCPNPKRWRRPSARWRRWLWTPVHGEHFTGLPNKVHFELLDLAVVLFFFTWNTSIPLLNRRSWLAGHTHNLHRLVEIQAKAASTLSV